ncbi:MAG: hypothetical protein WBD95_18840 [Xanthobacteraceae bacterium]
MTNECVEAFNAGVRAVLDIAAAAATKTRRMQWKPGREGAADALEELAEAGKMLLHEPGEVGQPDQP